MKKFRVVLRGFFGEVLFVRLLNAESSPHAVKMVAAEYNRCYMRAEYMELALPVSPAIPAEMPWGM